MNYTRKINVLHIIWSLEKGGAERFLVSLVKNFDQSRFNSIVCCLNWKGEWAKELEDKGVRVIALNKKGKFDLSVIFKIKNIIKQNKIDIVNTHLWAADVLGRIAAILAGVPVIISTVQNVDIWKKWWQKIIDRMLLNKTDKFITVSDAVKVFLEKEGIKSGKIEVIPNAIEIDKFGLQSSDVSSQLSAISSLKEFFGIVDGETVFAVIGRLVKQKGHKYLLEALHNLNGNYNFKLLIVGDGPLRESLQQSVVSYQLQDRVLFTGYRSDIPKILEISDCLVLPSLYEGLPVCVLEAMAAAKPVIATDVGGTKTIVKNNETGFLVQPKDSTALTQAIINLINLPDRGKNMGQKARGIVKDNFSIKSVAQKTEDLFTLLAKGKQ